MNKIGVLIVMRNDTDIFDEMKKVRDIGCECCQITIWDTSLFTDGVAEKIIEAKEKYGIEISTLWVGWSGPTEWNFTGGPMVLGIVPEAYRMRRTEEILRGADFAVKLGVSRIATHIGFLPENISDPFLSIPISSIILLSVSYSLSTISGISSVSEHSMPAINPSCQTQ